MSAFRELSPILISRRLHAHWKTGLLGKQWAQTFPQLFDADDVRLVASQAGHGYHFYEWFAAILLHRATGYRALVAKYEFAKHEEKSRVVEELFSAEQIALLRDRSQHGSAQAPDLLMVSPGGSYFFCEVKGPRDKFSKAQEQKFETMRKILRCEIFVLRFGWRSGKKRNGCSRGVLSRLRDELGELTQA